MRLYKHTVKVDGGKIESDKWYTDIRIEGRRYRFPLFESEKLSSKFCDRLEVMLAQHKTGTGYEKDVQVWLSQLPSDILKSFGRMGLVSQQRIEPRRTIDQHLKDYLGFLEHKGNTSKHVERTESILNVILSECKIRCMEDFSSSKITDFVKFQIDGEHFSKSTANHYIRAVKSFVDWLYKNDRMPSNPLKNLPMLKVIEKEVQRRAITIQEASYLFDWLIGHGKKRRSLTGWERSVLYKLALMTGLRADEIRHLVVSSIDFEAKTLTLAGAYTKNRKLAVLPVRDDILADLKELVRGKTPDASLFRHVSDKTAKVLYADLADARKHWIEQAKENEPERKSREKSDFLKKRTDRGILDFHALRHSFATMLVNSGIDVKTAQALMRHSSPMLTLGIYSHTVRGAEQAAVDKLPDFIKQVEAEKRKA